MNIASVIVDIPSMQVDKMFDYLIPEKWKETIQPGMRVIVPFGPRKIQGYVIQIKQESQFNKLREIIEPQDLLPVLNEELLELGNWLTSETLCLKISAYQAMLPAAMKAKYEKIIRRLDGSQNDVLDKLFGAKEEIDWQEAETRNILADLQREVKKGTAEVVYVVKNKAKKKTVRIISCPLSHSDLITAIDSLSKRAMKQKDILQFFFRTSKYKNCSYRSYSTNSNLTKYDKSFNSKRTTP